MWKWILLTALWWWNYNSSLWLVNCCHWHKGIWVCCWIPTARKWMYVQIVFCFTNGLTESTDLKWRKNLRERNHFPADVLDVFTYILHGAVLCTLVCFGQSLVKWFYLCVEGLSFYTLLSYYAYWEFHIMPIGNYIQTKQGQWGIHAGACCCEYLEHAPRHNHASHWIYWITFIYMQYINKNF